MISSVTVPRFRTVFVALLVVVALLGAACSSKSEPETGTPPDLSDVSAATVVPAEGDHAADFTVMTLDGAGFTLSEHLEEDGRPVFLNLWASWCPPCRAEMPDINSASQKHTDVKFIGISVNDDPVDSVGFATSVGITYTIGFDVNGDIAYAYNIAGLPASFIISSDGVILQRVFGAVSEADIDAMLDHWLSS